jgi:predicted RND superfamily exporter protein
VSVSSLANAWLVRTTQASLRHPFRFVGVALILLAVSAWLASGLEVRSSFEELLPSDVPSAVHAKELSRRVGGIGSVLVHVEAQDGPAGLPKAETLALRLTGDFLAMGAGSIRSVESTVNPTKAYFADHWPLFVPTADLEKALEALERRAEEESPWNLHLDDDAPRSTMGAPPDPQTAPAPPPSPRTTPPLEKEAPWLDPGEPLPRERVEERFARYKDGFMVHPDGASLTLLVRPAESALGVTQARRLLERMRAVVDAHQAELEAGHLHVGFAGNFPLFIAEYEAIIRDVFSTIALVVGLVLLSLLLFFRDLRSTVSLGIACISAVVVDFGMTRLAIGYLNTQTAFLGSIVIGNGINYGLIYLARVRQLRRAGMALEPACLEAAPVAARATLLASAASAVSFAMLIAAANRGFRHFGYMGGLGMLLCWAFTFALVPALLQLCERLGPVEADSAGSAPKPPANRPAPRWLLMAFARPRVVVAAFTVAAVASAALFVRQICSPEGAIETNLANLGNEPIAQRQLVRDNDRGNAGLGRSVAGVVALLPSREAADAYCVEVRERITVPRFAEVIQSCETLSSVLPTDQARKLALIRKIHARLTPRLVASLTPEQRERVRAIDADLAAQFEVGVEDVPHPLLDRFTERDGTVGRLAAVTAAPTARLEVNLETFVDGVRGVTIDGRRYDAAGENVVFADLLRNIETEGPVTTAGSLLGVCALVVLFFRNARLSAAVIAALVAGVVLMGGAAALLHLKINFFNFIVFPITFGIAVDYGANIVVRVRERGGDVLGALAEVGPAVALCSWTSIIGYATLVLALNRALQSFGRYAVVGEITSILTALIMLPALALWRRGSPRRARKLALDLGRSWPC